MNEWPSGEVETQGTWEVKNQRYLYIISLALWEARQSTNSSNDWHICCSTPKKASIEKKF